MNRRAARDERNLRMSTPNRPTERRDRSRANNPLPIRGRCRAPDKGPKRSVETNRPQPSFADIRRSDGRGCRYSWLGFRAAGRARNGPNNRYDIDGFRLARTL
jgi:hypothetical protein